jgi:hypothetical protein
VFSHFHDGCSRTDVVFDTNRKESIKSGTRAKRAGPSRSIRRHIDSRDVPLPVNSKQFIDFPENKSNLTQFLSEQLLSKRKDTLTNCEVITAGGFADETVAESLHGSDVHPLESNHDEADTRIILHGIESCQAGFERFIISCRDTYVLVLLVHFAVLLSQEIWDRYCKDVRGIQLRPALRRNIPA